MGRRVGSKPMGNRLDKQKEESDGKGGRKD